MYAVGVSPVVLNLCHIFMSSTQNFIISNYFPWLGLERV